MKPWKVEIKKGKKWVEKSSHNNEDNAVINAEVNKIFGYQTRIKNKEEIIYLNGEKIKKLKENEE